MHVCLFLLFYNFVGFIFASFILHNYYVFIKIHCVLYFVLKAAKLSSLSVEETSKSYVLHQLPSRYSNLCNDLPQVDVTDLLFSVDKPVVLHSLNLFGQPNTEYKFTVFVAKVCVCVCACVCVHACTHV